jgi:hypothetical protein
VGDVLSGCFARFGMFCERFVGGGEGGGEEEGEGGTDTIYGVEGMVAGWRVGGVGVG